jgi:hypothetical protein
MVHCLKCCCALRPGSSLELRMLVIMPRLTPDGLSIVLYDSRFRQLLRMELGGTSRVANTPDIGSWSVSRCLALCEAFLPLPLVGLAARIVEVDKHSSSV